MFKELNIIHFLKKSRDFPVLDVRTPDEFNKGHMTGAINFPLFSTSERDLIGRIYKEHGQEAAILRGLELISPKTGKFVISAKEMAHNNQLLLYCWRGGMRSASLAWLFDVHGIKSYVLAGGYKAYRNYLSEYFKNPFRLVVIGGMTGAGKTDILLKLKEKGKQVLDLESLAHHKGSAFGALGEEDQNSNEQFENDLFSSLSYFTSNKPIWVEDESQNIGRNLIPASLFKQILDARLICIETDTNNRINRLVRDYASFSPELIEICIKKISRRLGGLVTQKAIESLKQGDFKKVAELMLEYYDKTYSHSIKKRDALKVHKIRIDSYDLESGANKILRLASSFH